MISQCSWVNPAAKTRGWWSLGTGIKLKIAGAGHSSMPVGSQRRNRSGGNEVSNLVRQNPRQRSAWPKEIFACPGSEFRRQSSAQAARPCAFVVESRFFEQGVIKHFDHLTVTAAPRRFQGRPNIRPWDELDVYIVGRVLFSPANLCSL
jgi:hypothetical protein